MTDVAQHHKPVRAPASLRSGVQDVKAKLRSTDQDTANMKDYHAIFEAVESTLIREGLDHGGREKDEKREKGGRWC